MYIYNCVTKVDNMQEKIKQLEGSVANLAANTSSNKASGNQIHESESVDLQNNSANDV